MGHTGNMAARYSSNKAMLPDDLIESMRQAYERCMPILIGGGTDEEAIRRKTLLDFARLQGHPEQVLQQFQEVLENSDSVDDAIREITRSGIMIIPSNEVKEQTRKDHGLSHGDYVIVNSDAHLAKYLKDGYEWVSELTREFMKTSVEDEEWVTPNGTILSDGQKVYAHINDDGTIEMRGSPSTLNGVEEELVRFGVSIDTTDPGPRYLLRKKRSV
jgi:hypothetical protein